MAETIVIDDERQLVINEVNDVPSFVLKSLRDGARTGDCSELALMARTLSGVCLEYGLEPIEQSGASQPHTSTSRQTLELAFAIPEQLFLPQSTSNSASLVFLCVVMRHFIFIYCLAKITKSEEEPYSVSAAYCNVHIPLHVAHSNTQVVLSELSTLIDDLRSKLCAPSLSVAAYEIGRSLRLALPSLPEEILFNVLKRLDLIETLSLGMTCHPLLKITSMDSVWERLYRSQFQLEPMGDSEDESMKLRFVKEWTKRYKHEDHPLPHLRPLFRRGPRPLWINRRVETIPRPFPVGDADRLPFPELHGPDLFLRFQAPPPPSWLPPWRLS